MKSFLGGIKSAVRKSIAGAFHTACLYRWRHRGKVIILTYHRVLTPEELCHQSVQPGMYVLDTVFAQHMAFVKESFTVLSLQELLSLWQRNAWDEQARYGVITFDDGWLDNYRHAYPILKRLGLPATMFLPTDYVGSDQWFWPDQVAFLFKTMLAQDAKVEHFKRIADLLSGFFGSDVAPMVAALACQEQVTDRVIEHCKHLPITRIHELVGALAAEFGVSLPHTRVIVNWDEVREMSQGGMSFGSHSCSHRIMTTITSEEVSAELSRSEQALRAQGVNYVPVFCYPNGNSDPRIQSQVQAHGYEAAVSVQMGVEGRTPENRYAIRRVGIHNDVTHTIPLFSLRLFGPLPGSA